MCVDGMFGIRMCPLVFVCCSSQCASCILRTANSFIRLVLYVTAIIVLTSFQSRVVKDPLAVDGVLVRLFMNAYVTLVLVSAIEQRGTLISNSVINIYSFLFGKVVLEFGRIVEFQCLFGVRTASSPLHRWIYSMIAEMILTPVLFLFTVTICCLAILVVYRLVHRGKIQKLRTLKCFASQLGRARDYVIGSSADFCKVQLEEMRIWGILRYTDTSWKAVSKFFVDMIPVYVVTGVILYVPITFRAFQLITCAPLDREPNATRRFAHNVSLKCDPNDSVVVIAKVAGWITLTVWSVMGPIAVTLLSISQVPTCPVRRSAINSVSSTMAMTTDV